MLMLQRPPPRERRNRQLVTPTPPLANVTEVARRLVGVRYSADEVAHRTRTIYEAVLRQSPRITTGNFVQAASADLALLFDLYDEHFFTAGLRQLLSASG